MQEPHDEKVLGRPLTLLELNQNITFHMRNLGCDLRKAFIDMNNSIKKSFGVK